MSDADIIIANLNRRIAATQAYIDRHIAPKAEPERDLAHECDMEQLRKEQLRQEEVDPEELLGDPDEYDFDE